MDMTDNDLFSMDNQLTSRRGGRYEEIAREAESGKCVFCDLRDKYVLTERNGLVVTVNIFPYIEGQLLVIPRRHIERFSELTEEEVVTNFYLSQMALRILRKELGIEDVWMILRDGNVAGKTVNHLHWNIMPYIQSLNTWHYQEVRTPPVDLANKLRPYFKDKNEGT